MLPDRRHEVSRLEAFETLKDAACTGKKRKAVLAAQR
jgi:hypothetical protein